MRQAVVVRAVLRPGVASRSRLRRAASCSPGRRSASRSRATSQLARARARRRIENALHIDVERALVHALDRPVLSDALDWLYPNAHVPVLVGFLMLARLAAPARLPLLRLTWRFAGPAAFVESGCTRSRRRASCRARRHPFPTTRSSTAHPRPARAATRRRPRRASTSPSRCSSPSAPCGSGPARAPRGWRRSTPWPCSG